MAYRGNRRQGLRQKSSDTFPERIFRVLVLTGVLWVVSEFMRGRPDLAVAGTGLRSVLWLPLTIGVGLLGLHFVFRALAALSSNADSARSTFDDRRDPQYTEANAQTGPFKEVRWSSNVFAAIEWRRFEAVVEALFAQEGYETQSQLHGADGGVDIWLYSKNPNDSVSVVQCKHWQGNPVTVKELREFLGVMASHGIKRGNFATSSRYTADAMAFAKANGITAQNGNDLLRLIAQRSPEQQARLLEVAYEGEYWKPTCVNCGVKMVEREARNNGSRFWGCMNYPRCKCTLPMKTAN
ncbi:restriction endonuclease [Hydrogenophaga sp.]|uniref:restriction endonuclease n=1 Tax=Hydrogenophaga sp. TaxID=1904254 RepID=UPI002FCC502A